MPVPDNSNNPAASTRSSASRSKVCPSSRANTSSDATAPATPSTAAFSITARAGRSSRSRRAAIRTRSELGSSRPPSAASGNLASSERNSGLPPLRSYSWARNGASTAPAAIAVTNSSASTRVRGSRFSDNDTTPSTTGGHVTSASGRCAVISRNGRSASDRQMRCNTSMSRLSAHCKSSIHTITGLMAQRRRSASTMRRNSVFRARARGTSSNADGWPAMCNTASTNEPSSGSSAPKP